MKIANLVSEEIDRSLAKNAEFVKSDWPARTSSIRSEPSLLRHGDKLLQAGLGLLYPSVAALSVSSLTISCHLAQQPLSRPRAGPQLVQLSHNLSNVGAEVDPAPGCARPTCLPGAAYALRAGKHGRTHRQAGLDTSLTCHVQLWYNFGKRLPENVCQGGPSFRSCKTLSQETVCH